MTKRKSQKFSDIERRAYWEAHNRRCVYCSEPLRFRELFIDHIIPQSLLVKSDELSRLFDQIGVSATFDITSEFNLVPSCNRCNTTKAAKLFEAPRLILILEIAKSKVDKVLHLKGCYQKEAKSDQLRIDLSIALSNGSISLDEMSKCLASSSPEAIDHTLSQTLNLSDGTEIRTLSQKDVDGLLDEPILVNMGRENGLKLTHDNGQVVSVRTCREFESALGKGFYPYTMYEIKMASDFIIPLAILRAIEKAQIADKSFLDNPRVGVTDLHLIPGHLGTWNPAESPDTDHSKDTTTVEQLLQKSELSVKRVETGVIVLEDDGGGVMLMELFRSNILDEGNEEILVFRYDYATQGTFGAGSTGLMRRKEAESLFSWTPFPSETYSEKC